MKEQWKTVPYATRYEVSNLGNIRNKNTNHILKPRLDRYGYPKLTLIGNKNKVLYKTVHRVVAETWIENNDISLQVNHKDGIKINASVDNLEWCTNKQNIIHSYETLLNANTSHAKLYNIDDQKYLTFRSLKSLSKFLSVYSSVLVPLIKESRRNPIHGKYIVTIDNIEAMFQRANTKNFGKEIYVYDEITRTELTYPSILIAAYYTGVRCLGNIKKSKRLDIIGYQFSMHENSFDKLKIINKSQTKQEREEYLLKPYRKHPDHYYVYDYYSKKEYTFSSIQLLYEFFEKMNPGEINIKYKVQLAIGYSTRGDRPGLCKGMGVKSSYSSYGWFPFNEEVLLSNKNNLSATHVFYRVFKGDKSELALGHHGLCKALGYIHDKSFKSFNYEAVVKSLNIPNLRVERLNKPIP